MSPADVAGAGAAGGPAEALTIAECKANKCPNLNLASTDLTSVPEGVSQLKHVTSLNVGDNAIEELPAASTSYPPQLTDLHVGGCRLSALPDSLAQLPHLRKLHAGANKITNADAVFKCEALQHASLAYNCLSSVPSSLGKCPIISLDLSHNNLSDLGATLGQLQHMPALRILSLTGNPICLLPQYDSAVRSALKSLKFFDGTKLDVLGAPGSRGSTAPQHHVSASTLLLTDTTADTLLRLELTELTPEDPFKELRAMYGAAQPGGDPATAAAPAAGQPEMQPLGGQLPLQPFGYHVELTDVDGTAYASVPLTIQPPTRPATADVSRDTKAKAKAPPGKGEKVEPEVIPTLSRGCLSVTIGVNANTAWRDWLRKGIEVKLIRTKHTAVERPMTEAEAAEAAAQAAAAAKGTKGKGKGDRPETPPPVAFDIVTTQEVAGTTTVHCSPLVSGHAALFESTAEFIPVPALWDERGVRMGLEDERHPKKPSGKVQVRLILHAQGLMQAA